MLYFLYGEDTYRIKKKLKDIISKYKQVHRSSLSLSFFSGEDFDFTMFRDNFKQISIFQEKKLMVIKNVFFGGNKNQFLKYGEILKNSSHIIVIIEEKIPHSQDSLFSFLKNSAHFQEFKKLNPFQLRKWVFHQVRSYNGEITEAGVSKLIKFVGNDLWRMSNEIQKLVNYDKNIKSENIPLLVKSDIETQVFDTIDKLAEKDSRRALNLLEEHFQKGENPFYLLKMINFQFRNMLTALAAKKEGKSLKQFMNMKICSAYPAKKAWELSVKFNISELEKIYHRIKEIDLSMKTGEVDPEEGVRMLVTEI